ncbi:MAG: tetrahydromethanopterin S-methyltransferase subunit H [Candidatus Thorarchaeota archaeon]|nr:MAG: tetrahydromethanopterin S-methyltransferase subunit H [Candidatus Thorarchaeota archaeon]
MFAFEKEQIVHTIGGIRIGGVPGEMPTVLAGTIFYGGHDVVQDARKGVFDKRAATELIRVQDEMSDTTGNPALVQVFSESEKAVTKYLDFVAEVTDAPFLIDSTSPEVRIAGLRHAQEVGLLDRAIYNSISVSITKDELASLKDIHHDCAVILAFNPHDSSIAGRRAVLEDGVPGLDKGLLKMGEEVGITKPLIDTATTAMGAGAGSSASFIFVAKTLYGQPTGSGVHNAPSSWSWLRKYKKTNPDAYRACDVASALIVQMMGANFILYGPISNARTVFPVVAMADIFAAESSSVEFGVQPSENHPFRKLL